MAVLAIALLGTIASLAGRHLSGRWFNPVSVCAATWTGSLVLHYLRILPYAGVRPCTLGSMVEALYLVVFGTCAELCIAKNQKCLATRSAIMYLMRPWVLDALFAAFTSFHHCEPYTGEASQGRAPHRPPCSKLHVGRRRFTRGYTSVLRVTAVWMVGYPEVISCGPGFPACGFCRHEM